MLSTLRFRRSTGEVVESEAQIGDDQLPAGQYLTARTIRLGCAELRQHRVIPGPRRSAGYDRLDSEILAGRRLHDVADWTGYPPELSVLYGDDDSSADPYALIEPYQGVPLRDAGRYLLEEEQEAFQASLLTGLCWLAAAGLAHRALSPDTVQWDALQGRVQITDFSESAVFGAVREPVTGPQEWVAKEQQPRYPRSQVTDRDDIWAAGRLIFFVRQGEDLQARRQLEDSPLGALLDGVFGPPEHRPAARDLLVGRMGRRDPLPRGVGGDEWLIAGRRDFWVARDQKHHGAEIPPGAGDIEIPGGSGPGSAIADHASQEDRSGRDPGRRRLFQRRRAS